MSKEYVRQAATKRLAKFTGVANNRKSYPNQPDIETPESGQWLKLHDIEFVLHKVASIGSKPCTRRTGVIVIDAFTHLDSGTRSITELTDALEEWFFPWSVGSLWTSPANTVNYPDKGDKDGYYQSTVYVPFTYDED